MEEIVRFEGQNDHNELIGEVKFSKLELVSLPNLLSFYAKKEKMGSSSACAQLLFNVKVIFPVLYELSIAGVGVIEVWDKKSIAVFEALGSFPKMHPLLKELGWLHVKDSGKMEGIVGEVVEDGLRNEASFSKLAVLGLSGLPNLLSFYTKLGKVDTTDGNSTVHAQPLFNEKVTFPALYWLSITSMPKITEIWDKQPLPQLEKEAEYSCKLGEVYVKECDQLADVFPSYIYASKATESENA